MTLTISLSTLKRVLYGLIAVGAIAAASVSFALAQEDVGEEDINQEAVARIQFPIAELNGCANKEECKAYCDGQTNRDACFGFAKKHGLMKAEKIRRIEKRMEAVEAAGSGPGGCRSARECEAYCADVSRMGECISFAKTHGVMDERELAEAEKIQAALARGARLPGGCSNKAACEQHCSNPDNMDECMAFAEQAGFMDAKELEEAKRILPLMKSGQTPGGCRGRAQCEAYCQAGEHINECIAFAEKTGLAKPEELEMMRKTGGRGPGGCRGRIECETYCENPNNAEACFNFGVEHGLISPEELAQIQKAGGVELLRQGGPGGCRGKRECEQFCRAPENQEACFQFASERGLIPPEEAERIRELGGTQAFQGPGGCVGPRECEKYCSQEENKGACMEFFSGGHGSGPADRDQRGEFEGEFSGGASGGFEGEFNGERQMRREPPPFMVPGFSGPAGCATPRECMEFCKNPDNLESCKRFAPSRPPHGEDEFSGQPRDEFPGQGFPTEGFTPPPGFGEEPPGLREEGFEVPPGFMPPGVEGMTPEMKARMMREPGFDDRHFDERGIREEFEGEGEERAIFQERQQLLEREQIQENIRVREEDFSRRAEEEFQRREEFRAPPEGFKPPERFAPPPDGFRPEQFGPPEGAPLPQDFSPQSSAPRGNRGLARALSFALALIRGR